MRSGGGRVYIFAYEGSSFPYAWPTYIPPLRQEKGVLTIFFLKHFTDFE